MITHLLLGTLFVIPLSFSILALCAKRAPFGFEDASGFHLGFEPNGSNPGLIRVESDPRFDTDPAESNGDFEDREWGASSRPVSRTAFFLGRRAASRQL
jgi:hypothetical protein